MKSDIFEVGKHVLYCGFPSLMVCEILKVKDKKVKMRDIQTDMTYKVDKELDLFYTLNHG